MAVPAGCTGGAAMRTPSPLAREGRDEGRGDAEPLPRRRLVAPVLEAARRVHHDARVRKPVAVVGRPGVAGVYAAQFAGALQRLLDGRGIGAARLFDRMLDHLHGVVAERDPPEHVVDLAAAELAAHLV